MMSYNNHIELCEAVYFFDRINGSVDHNLPQLSYNEEIEKMGIHQSVYQSILRILASNELLHFDGECFKMTIENKEKYREILKKTTYSDQNNQHSNLFKKAIDKSQFFFDAISDIEYDIYSRCDFEVTFEIGKEVAKHINLGNKNVLELGGNSGGLGTALLNKNANCQYTIVDTKIPCKVGNEFNKVNQLNLKFVEGDVFDLASTSEPYDWIIIMNLLHDFDDIKCLDILKNCIKYSDYKTKFAIIEDVLTSEFEPKESIMHGLRLSVECRGGKQRTIDELENLFININYNLAESIQLDCNHRMLVMTPQ